jgi:histone deacetylase complex regulatory component SIN3
LLQKKLKTKDGYLPGSHAFPNNSMIAAPGIAPRAPRHRVSAHQDEIDFFDRVKKVLPGQVYAEFLKCLHLYSQEVLSPQELLQLVPNFLGKYPDLLKWFQKFLGVSDTGTTLRSSFLASDQNGKKSSHQGSCI